MTRERIEDFKEIVLPFLSRTLLKINYENMGKSDAEEFEKDFNAILDLAIKALEQEPKTGHWVRIKPYPLQMHDYECSECGHETDDNTENYCSNCGAKMKSEVKE